MKHVRQEDLIQLAANELDAGRRAELEGHLAECSVCQTLLERQEAVWRALGQWTPDFTQCDLLPGIGRKLAAAPAVRHPFWSSVRRISRIAAAVVIGVGGGYGAAHLGQPMRPSPLPVTASELEQAATESLGVRYFENPSPAGLYYALQGMSAASELGEGRP